MKRTMEDREEQEMCSKPFQFSWKAPVYSTQPDPSFPSPPGPAYPSTGPRKVVAAATATTRVPIEVVETPIDFEETVRAIESCNGIVMSKEQRDICHFAHQGQGNLVIDSVAGSGKTTTLLQCLWFIPPNKRVLILSFNKSVQMTMSEKIKQVGAQMRQSVGRRLPQCEVKTAHAQGLAALVRHYGVRENDPSSGDDRIKENKSYAVQLAMNEYPDKTVHSKLKSWKFHMASLLRMLMNLALECGEHGPSWSEQAICGVAEKYGIPIPQYNPRAMGKKARAESEAYRPYMGVLRKAYEICCNRTSRFDYDDMAYLPSRLNLPLTQYDLVLVDEAQDLSAIQVEMVARSLKGDGGRVIFVGDQNQSIYGFRGCLTESIHIIKERFRATPLPLHTCWRCSQSVISVAQDLVPHIRARPGAPMGSASMPDQKDIVSYMQVRKRDKGHLVLCRTNAPLVELAIDLQKRGIPAQMTARTVCENLKALLHQVEGAHWIHSKNLLEQCKKYSAWKREATKEQGEEGIEKHDQLDSLIAIVKSVPLSARSTKNILAQMDALFGNGCGDNTNVVANGDDEDKHVERPIRLMTIHQAKGLEEDCVYVTETRLLPHPKCKDVEWQLRQENNAIYIAITRAKEELYYFS